MKQKNITVKKSLIIKPISIIKFCEVIECDENIKMKS
ncbi:uncharacterized protein METZ01_LOCUS286827 [marine metagenome]|uniref:Uncharacterized protein n=1 Tax=marine metagenome TaxID=408172 RepID=A0A382LD01_9ZZZZ